MMKRYKITLETSTSCIGKCVGCALTSEQRASLTPAIEKSQLEHYFFQVKHFYDELQDVHFKNNKIDTIVLELILGEHFNFNDDYLHELFFRCHQFLASCDQKFILAISSSGLIAPYKMIPKLEIMNQYFDKKDLEINLVCDLNRFDQFSEKYQHCLDEFKKYFLYLSILANFDNHLNLIMCDKFGQFLLHNEITDFQLVYGLKKHNIEKIAGADDLFYNIYNRVLEISPPGYREKDIFDELDHYKANSEKQEIFDTITSMMNTMMSEQVFINYEGNVHFQLYTMFGAVELDERGGFDPLTNIYDKDAVRVYLNSKTQAIKKLMTFYVKNSVCHMCDFQEACYGMGLPFLADKFIKNDRCTNPVIHFYKNAHEFTQRSRSFESDDFAHESFYTK